MGDGESQGKPERPQLTVGLPRGLVERSQRLIETFPELGYNNRSSFVEEALRRWIEREEERALVMRDVYEGKKPRLNFDFSKKVPRS